MTFWYDFFDVSICNYLSRWILFIFMLDQSRQVGLIWRQSPKNDINGLKWSCWVAGGLVKIWSWAALAQKNYGLSKTRKIRPISDPKNPNFFKIFGIICTNFLKNLRNGVFIFRPKITIELRKVKIRNLSEFTLIVRAALQRTIITVLWLVWNEKKEA